MEKVIFDVGYGVSVASLHCKNCGFNITEDSKLKKCMQDLRSQMKKEVKIIQIGSGLGIRLPNNLVTSYNIKKGEAVMVQPELKGIRLLLEK